MILVNLVGTMSFIVWRLMMMATTVYFTCTVTGRDIPIKVDYDDKHVTIAVPPDDPPTITEVTKWAMELNQSCPNLPLSSISAQLDQGHTIQVRHCINLKFTLMSHFISTVMFLFNYILHDPGSYWATDTGLGLQKLQQGPPGTLLRY